MARDQMVIPILDRTVCQAFPKPVRIFYPMAIQILYTMVNRIQHQIAMEQLEVLVLETIQTVNYQPEFSGQHGIGSPIISMVLVKRLHHWAEGVMGKYLKYVPFNEFSDFRLLISNPGWYKSLNVF